MESCPEYFYRYRSIRGEYSEYVRKTICDGELYFSKPSSFNDPFDCRPDFDFSATDEEMKRRYTEVLKRRTVGMNRQQRRSTVRRKLQDKEFSPKDPKTIDEIRETHTKKIIEEMGVVCLSDNPADILMWSHYGDSHRGICLKFDGYSNYFAQAQRIIYSEFRPVINPFRQGLNETVEHALLTKSKHWEYEQEWRIIEYLRGPGVYKYPKEALVGIILGAHIEEQYASKIKEWNSLRERPVKIYKAMANKKKFSIDILG